MDKTELIKSLPENACKPGLGVFIETKLEDDIVSLFWDYIDFCLAMNYPSCDFIERNKDAANKQHLYVNHKSTLKNIEKAAFLGASVCDVVYTGFTVSRLYVKHTSKLNVKATDNAFVMIDALDSSDVAVETSGNARVIVNLYSKATSKGATKTIQKHFETYEL